MTLRIATPDDLRKARQRLNLTQRQVADWLGVPSNTVSRLERGNFLATKINPAFDSRWRSHLTLLFTALDRRPENVDDSNWGDF